ncbi:MAG: DUF6602 domain-containing protein [Synechocystis sp.]|jgi:hypothetical protein
MDVSNYFDSLSLEIKALKNRVRYLIGTRHFLTDGEWKESILRTILRRHLPSTVEVGRGFIVKPNGPSKQIDVLIYDTSKPILYQDGDLVMITPDSVKGIIEVKTKINCISELSGIINNLADNTEFINDDSFDEINEDNVFVGLFSYDSDLRETHSEQILDKIKSSSKGDKKRVISHLCLGSSLFVRFWSTSPSSEPDYDKWHSYWLHSKAPGYFVNNVVDATAKDSVRVNQNVWFPTTGKETKKLGEINLID